DGKKEAKIIASTDLHHFIKTDQTYLYVDVGGGSTEFTLFSEGIIVASKSFKAGTVRLLNTMITESVWVEIDRWIQTVTQNYKKVIVSGSGGNINKLFKMSGKNQSKPLTYSYAQAQYKALKQMTYEERVTNVELNA